MTADHKVLSDNCESRNNHRYAVVVQDRAAQWIQAYPCKNKTSQETQRSLQKFLEPDRNPKVIYTDNSLEFGKACEKRKLENSFNSFLEKDFVVDLPSQPNPNLIQLVIERGNLWSKKTRLVHERLLVKGCKKNLVLQIERGNL